MKFFKTFFFIFFTLLFSSKGDSLNYEKFISSEGLCVSSCDGSLNNPYPSLFQALNQTLSFYGDNSDSTDEFHFLLIPSSTPHFVNDNEEFFFNHSFFGKIFIESSDSTKYPIIEWESKNLALYGGTYLSISGVVISGKSVHVLDRTACEQAYPCCTKESYTNSSDICALEGQIFGKYSVNTVFEGLINLKNPMAILEIKNITIVDFYSIQNYKAFIYDEYKNSSIVIEDLLIENVFFQKGIILNDNSEFTLNFKLKAKNIEIENWNHYRVSIEFSEVYLFEKSNILSRNTIIAISHIQSDLFDINSEGNFVISFERIIAKNSNFAYFIFIYNSSFIFKNLHSSNNNGLHVYLQNCSASVFKNLSLINVEYISNDLRLFNIYDGPIFYIDNLKLENISGNIFYFLRTNSSIINLYAHNISFPYSLYFQPILLKLDANSSSLIDNITVFEIPYLVNPLIVEECDMTLKNGHFANIILDPDQYNFLIASVKTQIENTLFENIICPYAILVENVLSGQVFDVFSLRFSNIIIKNITGKEIGPILIIGYFTIKVVFENSIFSNIISGITFISSSQSTMISYSFINCTFDSIIFEMGYILLLFQGQTLELINSTLKNITYVSSSSFCGIFNTLDTNVKIESTYFLNITFPNGNGNILKSQSTDVQIIDSIFEMIYVFGKGGIELFNQANLLYNSNYFLNSFNQDEGFLDLSYVNAITVSNSSFDSLESDQYTIFQISEFLNLSVTSCVFRNVYTKTNAAIFYLSRKSSNYNISSANLIEGNHFENINSEYYSGAIFSLVNCLVHITFSKNFITHSRGESGTSIYGDNILSLNISNCTFLNVSSEYGGAALLLKKVGNLSIENSLFQKNYINYGQGNNIYFEDANLTIINSTFFGVSTKEKYSSQGSAIYGVYNNNFEKNSSLVILSCSFKNLEQNYDVIYILMSKNSFLVIEDIVLDSIILEEKNNIISCYQCHGSMKKINLVNTELNAKFEGNAIDLTFNSASNFFIDAVVIKNDTFASNSHFLKVYNITKLTMSNISFIDIKVAENLIIIQYFKEFILSNFNMIEILEQSKSNRITQLLLEISNGNNLIIRNLSLTNSISSFLHIDSQIVFLDSFKVQNHNASLDKFIVIDNSNSITAISNFIFSDSTIGNIKIYSYSIEIFLVYFKNITIYQNFLNSDSTDCVFILNNPYNQIANIVIYDIFFENVRSGLCLYDTKSIDITNFHFENSEDFKEDSKYGLIITGFEQAYIKKSKISNLKNQAIQIKNEITQPFSYLLVNETTISSSGNDEIDCGGIRIQGDLNVVLANDNFENNTGYEGSAVFFSNWNQTSNFDIQNLSFTPESIFSLKIYNNENFYKDFQQKYKSDLETSKINITSYAIKFKCYFKASEIFDSDEIEYYSGENVDVEFFAIDHFDQISNSLNEKKIEIIQLTSNYSIKNSKAIFYNNYASMPDFSIIFIAQENFSNIIPLLVEISDENNNILSAYTFNFSLKIVPCGMGYNYIENVCTLCEEGTYSLDQYPDELCSSCPSFTTCTQGNILIPDAGYWNINRNSLLILKCERLEACQINYNLTQLKTLSVCSKGYFGNVCHECEEGYGKTLKKTCEKCESGLYVSNFVENLFRLISLSAITLYQLNLIKNLYKKKNANFLLAVLNIFIYHSNAFAIAMKYQNNMTNELENFSNIQRIISFLENKLFGIYCLFSNDRTYNLFLYLMIYILIMVILQFFFVLIFSLANIILSRVKEGNWNAAIKFKDNLIDIICLLFYNNFITLVYYFIGLVFNKKISSEEKVSILFMELSISSREYIIIILAVILPIFLIFVLAIIIFFKKNKDLEIYLILDFKYKEKFRGLIILYFAIIFFLMIFSHYSFLGDYYAQYAKNLILVYLGILVGFKVGEDLKIQAIKIISFIILIVSLTDNPLLIICLNVVFYFLIFVVFGYYYGKDLKSTKKKKSKEIL